MKLLTFLFSTLLGSSLLAQNWNQIIKAAASDRRNKTSYVRTANDQFATVVAIDGNYAVVGCYNDDDDTLESNTLSTSGSAYIFYNNGTTWVHIKKLTASTRAASDNFGYSVAISGSYVIVGAWDEDEDANEANNLSGSGSAYIFKQNQGGTDNWGQIKKITASTRAAGDNFGISVAINGNYAVVGAHNEDEDASEANNLSASGSAYVFKASQGGVDNWGQIKKITASTRAASDNFGRPVSINGSYILVGSVGEDEDANEANTLISSGSAYIFKVDQGGTDNWGQIKKITAGTRANSDGFGWSLSISGSYAIVGAPNEDEDANEANTLTSSGSIYIFKSSQGGTDNWGQIKKITAGTREAGDNFGYSVSINGSYAIVGAYNEDEDANEANTLTSSGSAYIYKSSQGGADSWGLVKKRTASTRAASDWFGKNVAINGSYAIVGADFETEDASEANTVTGSGSAYFFKDSQGGADNWGQFQKVVMIGYIANDNYGYSVAIDGDYAIVGSRYDDEDATGINDLLDAGSAYILKYSGSTWSQIKKLTAGTRAAGDEFGISVAISGSYAIVGAHLEDENASENTTLSASGSAYIFKADQGGTDNWGQIKKITAGTRAAADQFGISVALSGSYAIVGANLEDENAAESTTLSASGSAYVFKSSQGGTDNWGQIKKITASTRAVDDHFGVSVAMSGSYAIVGAHQEDENASEASTLSASGSAYIFKVDQGGTDNWGQIKKIVAGTRAATDNFGYSVAIDGNYAIVGAYNEDEDASEANNLASSGSAYIFKASQGGADNWGQIKKIVAATRAASDYFGWSVAINGSYAIVGAYNEDEDVSEGSTLSASGSAYVYKESQGGSENWGQVKKLTASTRAADDQFGYSVAIDGGYAIVGANLEDENASELTSISASGSTYFFYNGCHPLSTLPSIASTTYTSNYKETDENGWTHYCTSSDQLLLSLKIGSSGAVVADNEVQLKTGSSTTFSSSSSGGIIGNANGYSIIDRRWNVSPTNQPSSGNVGVKYYFTNAEYTAEVAALAALASPTTITNANELQLYKATSGSAWADPHTVSGIVLIHGATPSTSVWKWAQQSISDHSAEFEVASFSGGSAGGGGGNAPLPVALLSFHGKIIKEDVLLQWTTATEINNDRFEIERSLNGKDFIKIGEVKGKRNNNQLNNYFYTDAEIARWFNASLDYFYYRLKQIDYNGEFEYSPIVVVSPSKVKMARALVSPNPFTNSLQVVLPKKEVGIKSIQITNLYGSLIMNIAQSKENRELINIDTQHLPVGMYIMTINQNDVVTNYKIIKE